MKAILLTAPKQLLLTDLPRPELAGGQVRVRVRKVGVCGSDYSSIAGKLPFTRFPIVVGHEASGEILESAAQGWQPGERVLLHPILCRRDEDVFARGEVHHSDSTEVLGVVSRNGAYAEEVVVEDYMLRRMTDAMDFETAAMVEPVAVSVRAFQLGKPRGGDRVLVFGAGNIGLILVQVARALGAGQVVVTDISPERLALARALGVDEAIDVREDYPAARLEKQFDMVIDGVGTNDTVNKALAACVRGGRIVVYGVPAGDINYPLKVAFSKDVTLATSRLYNSNFDVAIRLVAEGRLRLTGIITHRVTLDQAPALLLNLIDGKEKAIKVMIST
ncbi:MAG: zinc-binding dehydrogenase [Acidobacteriales bacterium]|nr:zinc-binding dehydrogenase [Terriglobales bacterium]